MERTDACFAEQVPRENHTYANIPLHLRQYWEERMTSEDEIPRPGVVAISMPPAGVQATH